MKRNEIFILTLAGLVLTLGFCLIGCKNQSSDSKNSSFFEKGDHVIKNAVRDADGNTYDAVQLGDQLWMQQDLINVGEHHVCRLASVENLSVIERENEPWFYVDPENPALFYNYIAVEEQRLKLCPEGWRIPTEDDWEVLERYLLKKPEYRCGNSDTYIAKSLADSLYWKVYKRPKEDDRCNIAYNPFTTNNATGFSARGYGYCYSFSPDFGGDVRTLEVGESARFWCKNRNEEGDPICILFQLDSPLLEIESVGKEYGCLIRCIKDK
ncbi:MAG: fibrobacter succinogenes major paralogous domain-containing protein [Bacteroidales bacterium]|nr:fibrobacter succinogenes major paralogous domain-containing protein [Bacteroidales bacterium]